MIDLTDILEDVYDTSEDLVEIVLKFFAFLTIPLWVIPYLIYKKREEYEIELMIEKIKGDKDNDT